MHAQRIILFAVSMFTLVTTATPVRKTLDLTGTNLVQNSAPLMKRGLFTCSDEDLEVTTEEQEIFKAYFVSKDACFFELYSDEYTKSRFRRPSHFHISEETTASKIEDVKIVARALKKVAAALKGVEFISVTPDKQARQIKTVAGAEYVLEMWNRIFRKLEAHESDAFTRCFLDRDVPYKSIQDFYRKLESLRGRVFTITKAFRPNR